MKLVWTQELRTQVWNLWAFEDEGTPDFKAFRCLSDFCEDPKDPRPDDLSAWHVDTWRLFS